MPRIAALMTTYNASRWIHQSVDSVLSQTFEDFELLVIDDGSQDETLDMLEGYNDSRLKVFPRNSNKGVGARLDEALAYVESPYIAKVDADDICLPNRFEKQLTFLTENDVDIAKCRLSYFADNDVIDRSERFLNFKASKERELNGISCRADIEANLKHWPCFTHATYFAKADVVKQVGYPHLRMFEDYVLFLRLLNAGRKFGCVDEVLVKVRVSDTSVTATLTEHDLDQGLKAVIGEKWERFAPAMTNKSVFVFGTGQMARSFGRYLSERNITISAFVEWEAAEGRRVCIGEATIPVISLDEYFGGDLAKIIVIAAQPARKELALLLQSKDMKEDDDFLILA